MDRPRRFLSYSGRVSPQPEKKADSSLRCVLSKITVQAPLACFGLRPKTALGSSFPKGLALAAVAFAGLLATSGCKRLGGLTHSEASVERAINDHLAQNRNLKSGSFQTKVESVVFKGDTASTVVRFDSRQSPGLFVEVRYGLRLEGGQWQVVSSTPLSGQGSDSHNAPQDQSLGHPTGKKPTEVAPQASH
jgi:hypothetical protein